MGYTIYRWQHLTNPFCFLFILYSRGRRFLKLKFRRILRHLRTFCRDLDHFLLSHHLDCKYFRSHYFVFGNIKLCEGCLLDIPIFLATILLFSSLFSTSLSSKTYILVGIALISTNIVNISRKTRQITFLRLLAKIGLGAGLGFIFIGIFTLKVHIILRVFLFLNVYGAINSIFGLYRMNSIQKVCRECVYKADWKNCDGFRKIYQRLKEHGFLVEE